jgi:hypothetical protein
MRLCYSVTMWAARPESASHPSVVFTGRTASPKQQSFCGKQAKLNMKLHYRVIKLQASAAMLMRPAHILDITQRRVLILYRRFGTTYPSYLQGSRSPTSFKMGPKGYPETSIKDYHSTLPNIPETRRYHHYRCSLFHPD